MEADLTFNSRRSPVVSLHGCVASSQPLASNIGLGECHTVMYNFVKWKNPGKCQQINDCKPGIDYKTYKLFTYLQVFYFACRNEALSSTLTTQKSLEFLLFYNGMTSVK